MKTTLLILITIAIFSNTTGCQNSTHNATDIPNAKVSYTDFENLVKTVKKHRENRLINFDDFLEKSKVENTIILDTRSKIMYDRKHIKGAIHLNFSDFTQKNLSRLIPDKNTTILIYCNNNFDGDEINFASKIFIPKPTKEDKTRSLTLALNIPTYINLYGYGYKNVYELNELISFTDRRITYKGTTIINTK